MSLVPQDDIIRREPPGGGPAPAPAPAPASGGSGIDYIRLADKKYGSPLPLVFGRTIVQAQCVYFGAPTRGTGYAPTGFTAGGGALWQLVANQTAHDVVMAVCEAPVASCIGVWYRPDSGDYGTPLADFLSKLIITGGSYEVITGATAAPWGGYVGTPSEGLAHSGTVQVRFHAYNTGKEGRVPILKFEIQGLACVTAESTPHAHFANLLLYLLTDTTHGLGLPTGLVNVETGADGLASSSFRRYLDARGWYGSRAIEQGESIASIIEEILAVTSSTLVWIDGVLTAIPLDDEASSTGPAWPGHAAHSYSPATSGVAIGQEDYFVEGNEDPVKIERTVKSKVFSVYPLDYTLRQTITIGTLSYISYVVNHAEVIDEVFTSANNLRRAPRMDLTKWVLQEDHALQVCYAAAQRAIKHRTKYTFPLKPRHCLVAPGDFLALTESKLGLSSVPVRVETAEEQRGGSIEIVAREWPLGSTKGFVPSVVSPTGLNPPRVVAPTASYDQAAAAQTDATSALANAATAQSTANSASTAASNAQTTANSASSAASSAQSTADGKNKVSYGIAPHTPAQMFDLWLNSDYGAGATNCPNNNCKGHLLDASGTPLVGAYPHRKKFWVHTYNGASWLDAVDQLSIIASDMTVGSVVAAAIAADALATSDFAESGGVPTGGVKMLSVNTAPAWAGSTTYTVGLLRKNGANVYRCITAGTSAASGGPTGTGSDITDGTAHWAYYRQLRIGPGGAQVGRYELSEPVVSSLTALARSGTSVSDLVWYRGNDDPSFLGGAPILMDFPWGRSVAYSVGNRVIGDPVTAGTYPINWNRDGSAGAAKYVYRCTTAGTSAATGAGPTGTGASISDGTVVWAYVGPIAAAERVAIRTLQAFGAGGVTTYQFRITIQPTDNNDNLDGLLYCDLEFYTAAKATASNTETRYVAMPFGRGYYAPGTIGDVRNGIKTHLSLTTLDAINYGANPFPFNGYIRFRLRNVQGVSIDRDFDFSALTTLGDGVAGGWTLGGVAPQGGGGSGGGSSCPAPEVGVLLADGTYRPAGLLQVGDRVWSIGEDDGPGVYEVTQLELCRESERLALGLDDGTRLVYSPRHPVMTPSGWCAVKHLRAGDRVMTIHGERRVASVLPVAAGPVVRIATSGHTYVTEAGLLNHNLKAL